MIQTQLTGASFARGKSRQDYETPPDFMAAVVKRFGVINCDLAARADNTKGQTWFDIAQDSLSVDWHKTPGNLWLNPPFDNITPWARKCAAESVKGAKILFLVPASVGSNWFVQHVFDRATVYFLNGRLQFVGAKDPYPKDCFLAAYGYGAPGFDVWRWKI